MVLNVLVKMNMKLILFLTILITIMKNAAQPLNVTKHKNNRNIGKPFTVKLPEERRKLSIFPKHHTIFSLTTKQFKEDISEETSTLKYTRALLIKRIRNITMATVSKQPTEPSRNGAYLIKPNMPEDEYFRSEEDELEAQASMVDIKVIKEFDGINSLIESTEYPKEEIKRIGDETVQILDKNDQLIILTGGNFEEIGSLEEEQVEDEVSSEKGMKINNEIYDSRLKRNVIDEENLGSSLGSTISGFKFTGRGPRLSNGFNFNNINV